MHGVECYFVLNMLRYALARQTLLEMLAVLEMHSHLQEVALNEKQWRARGQKSMIRNVTCNMRMYDDTWLVAARALRACSRPDASIPPGHLYVVGEFNARRDYHGNAAPM